MLFENLIVFIRKSDFTKEIVNHRIRLRKQDEGKWMQVNIDLELYRIFYVVAKYENISKATQELYISQPAVTQRISNLEKQLKSKLFERKPGGMKLTKEGRKLYNCVENKFEQYLLESKKGYIKIKVSSWVEVSFLSRKIVAFSKKYPEIGVNLEIGTEEEAIYELKMGMLT